MLHKSKVRGYDIDGVITAGIKPFGERTYIVTGRSHEEAPSTMNMLAAKRIFNAVYFNPVGYNETSRENSGLWKAKMIQMLGIEDFWEDDMVQIDIIKKLVPSVVIYHVQPGISNDGMIMGPAIYKIGVKDKLSTD